LYVGYANGNFYGTSAINEFSIDATNLQLVPTIQQTVDLSAPPVGLLTDTHGKYLYIGYGPNALTGVKSAGADLYSIDSTSGNLSYVGPVGAGSSTGHCVALDAQGRFLFEGWGQNDGFLSTDLISPADGTTTPGSTIDLGASTLPRGLLAE